MSATYKIGEAASLLNLKTYVLRFWETEFSQIIPLRTEKGQRLYTEENLALLSRIRFLLHERGLTIEGARKVLAEEAARGVNYVRGHPSIESWHGLPDEAAENAEQTEPVQDDDPADEPAGMPGGFHSRALFDVSRLQETGAVSPAKTGGSAPAPSMLPLPGIAGNASTRSLQPAGTLPRNEILQGIAAELESVAAILKGALPGKTI